eukprot:m.1073704 g.1073704  ORF g.1073704 m.1073704 type:complete len:57 (-) comp24236_c0_seq2:49-219(-)
MAGLSAACNQLIVTVQGFPLIVLRFVVDGPEPHFMRMKWAITGVCVGSTRTHNGLR